MVPQLGPVCHGWPNQGHKATNNWAPKILRALSGNIVAWWELLNPTNTPSTEKAVPGEIDSHISGAEVPEVVKNFQSGRAQWVDEIQP